MAGFAGLSLRLYWHSTAIHWLIGVSAGMTRADVIDRCGNPVVVKSLEELRKSTHESWKLPQREVEKELLVFSDICLMVLVYIDNDDRVSAVYLLPT